MVESRWPNNRQKRHGATGADIQMEIGDVGAVRYQNDGIELETFASVDSFADDVSITALFPGSAVVEAGIGIGDESPQPT